MENISLIDEVLFCLLYRLLIKFVPYLNMKFWEIDFAYLKNKNKSIELIRIHFSSTRIKTEYIVSNF